MALKLFVWTHVLVSYDAGIMFALAEDEEQARRVIIEDKASEYPTNEKLRAAYSYARYQQWVNAGRDTDDGNRMWIDLQSTPDVYDTPVGFYMWGGD